MSRDSVEAYLSYRARGYHEDKALDLDGDGIPDAPAIRELLQDDIFELAGDWSAQEFEDLINQLSQSPPEDPTFRAPDPTVTKRLRQQTRAQGGYSGKGAWKSRTPNE